MIYLFLKHNPLHDILVINDIKNNKILDLIRYVEIIWFAKVLTTYLSIHSLLYLYVKTKFQKNCQ